MTFALFGEAAKDDQEPASLRSDHADAALLTEVELVFDVGGKRFVAFRRPEQRRPKQRGDGETGAHTRPFCSTRRVCLSRRSPTSSAGKIIAEKRSVSLMRPCVSFWVTAPASSAGRSFFCRRAVREVSGAKTKERLEILRDLFDVRSNRNLAARLKADAAEAESHVIAERELCAKRLAAEGFESTDALAAGIAEAESNCLSLREIEDGLRLQWAAAQTRLEQARTLERQFADREDAQAFLASLLEGKAEMDALADRNAQAERARVLRDAEHVAAESTAEMRNARSKREAAVAALDHAKAREKAAAADAFDAERARSGELDALRQNLEVLGRFALALDRADGVARSLTEARWRSRMRKTPAVPCKPGSTTSASAARCWRAS